jgi:hypothetical protein
MRRWKNRGGRGGAGLQVTTEIDGYDFHPLGEFQSSNVKPDFKFCPAAIAAHAAVHHSRF